ncbi:MAG: methyltransferase type 11 [Deltaproteobacteria bacterium]|nr:methyltransferase type 11 [Deltaproteobacteria bacterium]
MALARGGLKLARALGFPVRERGYQVWYDTISELSELLFSDFHCMNYGYAPAPESAGPERHQLGLYDYLALQAPLRDKRVLEVGSGRGGGAAHVLHAHGARAVTGLDLSERAVEASRARFDGAGLRFVPGHAAALPFGDSSFDVLINVESSHCYPDVAAFLAEARRVLVAEGVLLLADFRHREEVGDLEAQVAQSGFKVGYQRDITPHVVAALEADDARKRNLIDSGSAIPDFLRRPIYHFAGCKGSPMYEDFRSGRRVYLAFALAAGQGRAAAS